MPPSKRRRKPDLDRSAPIRNFSTIFGPPPREPVAEGVDLGYRVIEEYMQKGQEFARSVFAPSGGADRSGDGNGFDPKAITSRLVKVATDFAGAWLDMMQMTVDRSGARSAGPVSGFDLDPGPGPATAAPGPGKDGGGTAAAPPALAAAPVTIDIESKRRVEISVEIKAPPPGSGVVLLAHDLRAPGATPGAKPARIAGVTLARPDPAGPIVVRIKIPDHQAPGVYSGLIVDAAENLPRGTISVRVGAP